MDLRLQKKQIYQNLQYCTKSCKNQVWPLNFAGRKGTAATIRGVRCRLNNRAERMVERTSDLAIFSLTDQLVIFCTRWILLKYYGRMFSTSSHEQWQGTNDEESQRSGYLFLADHMVSLYILKSREKPRDVYSLPCTVDIGWGGRAKLALLPENMYIST
jgi:hypothetical protein